MFLNKILQSIVNFFLYFFDAMLISPRTLTLHYGYWLPRCIRCIKIIFVFICEVQHGSMKIERFFYMIKNVIMI